MNLSASFIRWLMRGVIFYSHALSPVVPYLIRSLQSSYCLDGQESHVHLLLTIRVVYVCSHIDKSIFVVFIKYRDVFAIECPQPGQPLLTHD